MGAGKGWKGVSCDGWGYAGEFFGVSGGEEGGRASAMPGARPPRRGREELESVGADEKKGLPGWATCWWEGSGAASWEEWGEAWVGRESVWRESRCRGSV